ncbi:TRF4 [Auxenochlorella protothecoides x Auxenochlorella symbiontica]
MRLCGVWPATPGVAECRATTEACCQPCSADPAQHGCVWRQAGGRLFRVQIEPPPAPAFFLTPPPEIVELARYLTPLPEEAMQRNAAIQRVRDVVACIWPEAQVKVFGSFATGLYLPTSDIDAVVLGSGCEDVPQGLKALASALHRKHLAKDIQVITKAKVPIIKFEETESCYKFDISFDVANGPEAAESVRALMDVLPPMRHLVMVLKVFLHQRDLNEVYAGGLGSYALLVLVAAFLQLHPSRQPSRRFGKGPSKPEDLEQNLGILLIDFFRLYGRTLNTYDVREGDRRGRRLCIILGGRERQGTPRDALLQSAASPTHQPSAGGGELPQRGSLHQEVGLRFLLE